jgi:hypothetical protein
MRRNNCNASGAHPPVEAVSTQRGAVSEPRCSNSENCTSSETPIVTAVVRLPASFGVTAILRGLVRRVVHGLWNAVTDWDVTKLVVSTRVTANTVPI